jgi:hypothetical protein
MVFCLAAILYTSIAAFAQEQNGPQNSPAHTIPPPPHAQPQAPDADLAGPAAVGPAQSDSASGRTNPTPLGATGQTMPSTLSKSNAALDRLPIVALQLPLTDEQKRLIAKSVSNAPNVQTKANLSSTHVAMTLPIDVPVQPFPDSLIQQVPDASRYKYLKLDKRVLIVDPIFRSIVGEVEL